MEQKTYCSCSSEQRIVDFILIIIEVNMKLIYKIYKKNRIKKGN